MRKTVTLILNGQQTTIPLANTELAHGVGLDGKTSVESLTIGESADFPGKLFVGDVEGNSIVSTTDELFAAAQCAAARKGKKLIVTDL